MCWSRMASKMAAHVSDPEPAVFAGEVVRCLMDLDGDGASDVESLIASCRAAPRGSLLGRGLPQVAPECQSRVHDARSSLLEALRAAALRALQSSATPEAAESLDELGGAREPRHGSGVPGHGLGHHRPALGEA